MIASLLEKRFSDRQLVVFTHDREWFAELRQQLDSGRWSFVALMPYATPEVGIRWSAKTSTLDDGRAVLDTDPDRAGNIARKIMDVELALAADRLKLKMPYLYRERNDHRVAHDFISRLVGDGRKCLQIQRPTGYECYEEALEAFREADRLLVTWGNKSSHSFDVVRAEAEALISVCESALSYLQCPNCGKAIYRLEDGQSELVQCSCGHVRWAYGKV